MNPAFLQRIAPAAVLAWLVACGAAWARLPAVSSSPVPGANGASAPASLPASGPQGEGERPGRTGVSTQGQQLPLAWAKVYGQQDEQHPITLRLWGDGELRHTATFTNLEPQRLPPGRWLEHQVEIEGTARVTSAVLTSTTEELRSV